LEKKNLKLKNNYPEITLANYQLIIKESSCYQIDLPQGYSIKVSGFGGKYYWNIEMVDENLTFIPHSCQIITNLMNVETQNKKLY
jgi:hypothetical protein